MKRDEIVRAGDSASAAHVTYKNGLFLRQDQVLVSAPQPRSRNLSSSAIRGGILSYQPPTMAFFSRYATGRAEGGGSARQSTGRTSVPLRSNLAESRGDAWRRGRCIHRDAWGFANHLVRVTGLHKGTAAWNGSAVHHWNASHCLGAFCPQARRGASHAAIPPADRVACLVHR